MYNNETAGPAFEEFLDLLGQRVRLKGFSKYRAQLDNKSKLHAHKFVSPKVGIPYKSKHVLTCPAHPDQETAHSSYENRSRCPQLSKGNTFPKSCVPMS